MESATIPQRMKFPKLHLIWYILRGRGVIYRMSIPLAEGYFGPIQGPVQLSIPDPRPALGVDCTLHYPGTRLPQSFIDQAFKGMIDDE